MIKQAIKNSLKEQQNSDEALQNLEEMKTLYPTEQEFANPLVYFEKLYAEGFDQYGVVKIIPPKDFKPALAFDQFSERKLPTRY